MKIFLHKNQLNYAPKHEFNGTRLKKSVENPTRISLIKQALKGSQFEYTLFEPKICDLDLIKTIHDVDYVEFLQSIPDTIDEEAPHAFSYPYGRVVPKESLKAKLGYYLFDPSTPLTKKTFESSYASVSSAVSCIDSLQNQNVAVALCRPPGHHAMKRVGGGYCFFNNVAIAAMHARSKGKSVSILDVDYHHGNGTQEIFYNTSEVLYVSLHADPREAYPYYWGSKEEQGEGEGKGFNVNFPLPKNTSENVYETTLKKALNVIADYNPDYLLVSLGLDIYKGDPVGGMNISSGFFNKIGEEISKFLKIGIFLEGGYSQEIGKCFVNVLKHLES